MLMLVAPHFPSEFLYAVDVVGINPVPDQAGNVLGDGDVVFRRDKFALPGDLGVDADRDTWTTRTFRSSWGHGEF